MKLIDMHCDTIMALMDNDKELRKNDLMIDLEKLIKGDYLLQCFAMFVPYKSRHETENYSPFRYCNKMIDRYYQELDKNKDLISPVFTYDDIITNIKNNKMSALLTIEEGGVCEGNIEFLRNFYRLGVRMITLTWNFKNEIATPNIDFLNPERMKEKKPDTLEGLSPFGIEFIHEMNRLGIVIDCSHLGDKGFYDVIKYSKKPVVCSHSNARGVCGHLRNLTDDMLYKLRDNGGVIGINYCHDFVTSSSESSKIDDLVKHIDYIKNLIGIDYIGLGSDFDGISNENIQLKDASMMSILIDALTKKGYTDEDIDKLCNKNVLRVLKANLK